MKKIIIYLTISMFLATVVKAQAIVRSFNSDAFVTAYINGHAYGYNADNINRHNNGPRNSCVYESVEKTKDGVVIGREEVKRCHEEVKTGENDSSFIKDFIASPLGETLIVLASSLLLQTVAAGGGR